MGPVSEVFGQPEFALAVFSISKELFASDG